MKKTVTNRAFTLIKRVGQAMPDNAPAKGHLAAFTLIELLVVVLIIGILAAVAVPQYRRAVEKSKATEAITLAKSVFQAYKTYFLANGTYPTKFSQLDVEVPWAPSNDEDNIRANQDWQIRLSKETSAYDGIHLRRSSGPYTGIRWYIWNQYQNLSTMPTETLICAEEISFFNNDKQGSYCNKLFNGIYIFSGKSNHYYKISM